MLIKTSATTQIHVDDALLELERWDLEQSLYDFTVAAWPHIDSAPFAYGGFALQAMCEHLQACCDGYIPNLLINVPPRFSKSTLCGVMFPAWVWAQRTRTQLSGPGVQFLHAGYAMNLALQDSVKCRALITSDWYQRRWGDRFKLVGDQNTKTRFQNNQQGIRNTTSVGGSTTGLGGNYLIGDDLNNSAEANSEAIIESTINWWDTAWYNRLNDSRNGCRIVIAQRLSEMDISGHVLEQNIGSWTHLLLPMRYEPDRSFHTILVPAEYAEDGVAVTWKDERTEPGELLWEERFGEDQVRQLERTLGPSATAGQLQQRPSPAGGGIIKRDWWKLWPEGDLPDCEYILASLDTAYTVKTENDYSALSVWGVFTGRADSQTTRQINREYKSIGVGEDESEETPKVMLMFAWQERLPLHELVLKVAATCKKLKVDKLLIENKAAGHSVAQEMRRLYGHEEFGVQLYDPKSVDKVSRLYSVQHLFAEGMIYAPDRAWADMVITQTENFPKGKNDDLCLTGDTLITMHDMTTKKIEEVLIGDYVFTPQGPCIVTASSCTGIKEIFELKHTYGTLRGTENHPVWANNKWKPLAELCPNDVLETLYQRNVVTPLWAKQLVLKSKLLFLMVINIVDILTLPILRTVGILAERAIDCTEMFGNIITAVFQMVCRSIILMGIQQIMIYQIWNACRLKHTAKNMRMNIEQETNLRNNWLTSLIFELKQRRGIKVKKVALGIENTQKLLCGIPIIQNHIVKVITQAIVNGAGILLKLKIQAKKCVGLFANCKSQHFCVVKTVTNTRTMLPVYNLTVEGAHSYYADNVLTHNCDTVAQALRHMRDIGLLTRNVERLAEIEADRRHTGAAPRPLYEV